MKKETINEKYVKYEYVLNEMYDDIQASIAKITDVIDGQKELIKVLEDANNSKFNDFLTSLKNTTEQYEKQKKILLYRAECAKKVKAILATSKEANFMLTMLLETLGVVNKDAKSIEERANNKEDVENIDIVYKA